MIDNWKMGLSEPVECQECGVVKEVVPREEYDSDGRLTELVIEPACKKCSGTGHITEVEFPLWEEAGEYDREIPPNPYITPIYYTPEMFAEEYKRQTGKEWPGFLDSDPVWHLVDYGNYQSWKLTEWRMMEVCAEHPIVIAFPGQPAPPNGWEPGHK